MRAHTVVAAVLQRVSGVAPPRQRTNAGCLHFLYIIWDTQASWLIYEEGVCSSPRYRTCTDFFSENFIGKIFFFFGNYFEQYIFSRKNLWTSWQIWARFLAEFNDPFFPRKFLHKKRLPHIAQRCFLKDLEDVIHSRFPPQPKQLSFIVYRLATAGPVVSAPRTSARRLGGRLSSMQ